MNVSKLVHDKRQTSKGRAEASAQKPITEDHPRGLESYGRDMASALTASPYSSQAPAYARTPQSPSSSPAEDPHAKCTLPSIQSLIGMTDDPTATDMEQQRKWCAPTGRWSRPPSHSDMPSQRKRRGRRLNHGFTGRMSTPPSFDRRITVIPA